jgi:DNA-binding response OmpR family regulator
MNRVLIVEDEPALMRGLTDTFQSRGLEVIGARDGEAGLSAALTQHPALIVLDIMLPRMNGYEVCRAIRHHGIGAPILMLTAKGQEEDIVLGLNLGADDYLTKPFKIGELLARVQALLRRTAPTQKTHAFADCVVDLEGRTLRRRGRLVSLTAKEFSLLSLFLTRPGRALSRDTILDAVWGSSIFVTPRSIDRCVTTLRAKVERDPRHPVHIQTLREIGYKFEPDP